jgi:hypothetical protein
MAPLGDGQRGPDMSTNLRENFVSDSRNPTPATPCTYRRHSAAYASRTTAPGGQPISD